MKKWVIMSSANNFRGLRRGKGPQWSFDNLQTLWSKFQCLVGEETTKVRKKKQFCLGYLFVSLK